MKLPIACCMAICLCACATTDPKTAARILYKLPRTDAKVTLGIDVTHCDGDLEIITSFKVDASPGAQDDVYEVSGAYLASKVTKRGLTVDVDENGVISGINAVATDQQTAILGNVLKIAATLVGVLAAHEVESKAVLRCNAAAVQNLALKAELPRKIDEAKRRLVSAGNPESIEKEIVALTSRLAAATVSLHQDIVGKLKIQPSMEGKSLDDPNSPTVEFDLAPLKSLFDTTHVGKHPKLTVPGVNDETARIFRVVGTYTRIESKPRELGGVKEGPKFGPCSLWMTLPSPILVKVYLAWRGDEIARLDNNTDKSSDEKSDVSQVIPAAQLAPGSELCLSAGFGENRTVGLKFDRFGRTTQFVWSSDASAANATGAVAGASSDASTLVKQLQGKNLADEKRELDELTTEQALRKARACQALLDAGATSCPSN